MSSESRIEQDREAPSGGQELPTYDDLAAQNGPNSRFGRWRSWIEKRAAERYADVSPEERARRRQRGWGNDEIATGTVRLVPRDIDALPHSLSGLHIQTHDLPLPSETLQSASTSLPSPVFKSQRLPPSHLKISHFGSRFLPHATSPIRCLLALDSGRLLLIGHDEGLSVLDTFPQEWVENGLITTKGPDEARARPIWHGESVYQMSLLEAETGNDGSLQGVVLALVGSDTDAHNAKDADPMRSVRMYNLSSLINLAKWTISQKEPNPLDLQRPSNWHVQQSPSKRSKGQTIARNLKAFIDPPPTHSQDAFGLPAEYPSPSSPSSLKAAQPLRNTAKRSSFLSVLSPNRKDWDEMSWDVVDDVQLRWATDFVPLASAGSRLLNASVLSYALWSDEGRKGKGGHLLAVATKSGIFLYETPKGERVFKFVKEFYIPLQPRSITFFQQFVQENPRGSLDTTQIHRRTNSSSTIREGPRTSPPSSTATVRYGTHLSLFVVFDKKAGWIRLADAAVGEFELYDTGPGQQLVHQRSTEHLNSGPSILRGRMSFDASHASKWIPIVRAKLPHCDVLATDEVYLLTRGKQTHIVPCPLPTGSLPLYPLGIVTWNSPPVTVAARVYEAPDKDTGKEPQSGYPFLQLVSFGEHGVEVQETPLSSLGKGKDRARQTGESIWALEDLGGDANFLCTGGHWDQSLFLYSQHSRSPSNASAVSRASFSSVEMMEKLLKEEGIYASYRKDMSDWRVFWVGGSTGDEDDIDDGDDHGDVF